MNKMIMTIVSRARAESVLEALIAAGYKATFGDSRGGKLRQAQMMLFTVVEAEDVERVLKLSRQQCRSDIPAVNSHVSMTRVTNPTLMPPRQDGATIFVWDVERVEIY